MNIINRIGVNLKIQTEERGQKVAEKDVGLAPLTKTPNHNC